MCVHVLAWVLTLSAYLQSPSWGLLQVKFMTVSALPQHNDACMTYIWLHKLSSAEDQ
jgi:hypothetical protein